MFASLRPPLCRRIQVPPNLRSSHRHPPSLSSRYYATTNANGALGSLQQETVTRSSRLQRYARRTVLTLVGMGLAYGLDRELNASAIVRNLRTMWTVSDRSLLLRCIYLACGPLLMWPHAVSSERSCVIQGFLSLLTHIRSPGSPRCHVYAHLLTCWSSGQPCSVACMHFS